MASHVDEYGSVFTASFVEAAGISRVQPVDLRASAVTFLFRKPSGTVVEVSATVTKPRRGVAVYTTGIGFLDEVGVWEWQPKVITSTGQFWGQTERFNVDQHLIPT